MNTIKNLLSSSGLLPHKKVPNMRTLRRQAQISRSGVCIVLCMCFSFAKCVYAGVVNGDFQTGNLTGWQVGASDTGFAFRPVPDENPGSPFTYPFAMSTTPLTSQVYVGSGIGNDGGFGLEIDNRQIWMKENFTGPDGNPYTLRRQYYTLSLFQDLQLSAGSLVTGWARFGSEDLPGYGDFASVTMNGSLVWRYDLRNLGNSSPNWSDGPWQQWQYFAPADAAYRLSLNVYGDDQLYSGGYFDNIRVTDVPEPSASKVLGLGFAVVLGLQASKRHRHRAEGRVASLE